MMVDTIGHRVAHGVAGGTVHSVFARHCNLACGDALLTVSMPPAPNGPTVIRLVAGTLRDLRTLFEPGEPVASNPGVLQTPRVRLHWQHARIWRPAAPRPRLPAATIAERLRHAEWHLALRRATQRNVIDGAAASTVAMLRSACVALDTATARELAARLIGWGEGLTPAGDDLLAGLLVGLDALAPMQVRRRDFRAAIAATVMAQRLRTTAIAAHGLRLAAAGHHGAPLLELREALLEEPDRGAVDRALHAALSVGATSGADMVSGLLVALRAWAVPAQTDRL